MNHKPGSIREFLKQPALSLGESLSLAIVILGFWGTVFILFFVDSLDPACAADQVPGYSDEERMLRDFGLLPEAPLDLTPVRIEYSGAPVPIVVGVGTERRLIFGHPFRIGLDPAVSGFFDLEIYDRHLLVRALRPVSTRARVQLASGLVIPLDIRAVAGVGPSAPLEIAIAQDPPATDAEEEKTIPASALPQPAPAPGYVDLVRHAAQRLYAPERLWTDRAGIRTLPVDRSPQRLIRGVRVDARPIAAWEDGGLVVTAVRIDNLEERTIRLDPRNVVGQWRAAAFQHGRLQPGAATALYLVADRPFESALGIHLYSTPEPGPDDSRLQAKSPDPTSEAKR